jgi:hypothetical protein
LDKFNLSCVCVCECGGGGGGDVCVCVCVVGGGGGRGVPEHLKHPSRCGTPLTRSHVHFPHGPQLKVKASCTPYNRV